MRVADLYDAETERCDGSGMGIWILSGYDNESEELVIEASLPDVTIDMLRAALRRPDDDPMIDEIPLPAAAAHVVAVDVAVDTLDFANVDYFVGEYSSGSQVERRDGFYLPPRMLPFLPDARPAKPRTPPADERVC